MNQQYNQALKQTVIELFHYFYHRITRNYGFELDLKMQNQGVQLDNFIKKLNKHYKGSVGDYFLTQYFCYQFDYWLDKDYNKNTSFKISLSWIIGNKAFNRWFKEKNKARKNFHVSKNLNEKGINVSEIFIKFDKYLRQNAKVIETESDAEKIEKLRFFNTERGLLNCVENTTMYRKTVTCLGCDNKATCKEILRETYPELYKKRNIK